MVQVYTFPHCSGPAWAAPDTAARGVPGRHSERAFPGRILFLRSLGMVEARCSDIIAAHFLDMPVAHFLRVLATRFLEVSRVLTRSSASVATKMLSGWAMSEFFAALSLTTSVLHHLGVFAATAAARSGAERLVRLLPICALLQAL